ncbi:hypothetical protein BY996DRAFT_6953946 [Phakopsora pachyrhizi]|nr:hypothetical protein BY996DRAFT_6953946 [Phakopsora pachyrhizi]
MTGRLCIAQELHRIGEWTKTGRRLTILPSQSFLFIISFFIVIIHVIYIYISLNFEIFYCFHWFLYPHIHTSIYTYILGGVKVTKYVGFLGGP